MSARSQQGAYNWKGSKMQAVVITATVQYMVWYKGLLNISISCSAKVQSKSVLGRGKSYRSILFYTLELWLSGVQRSSRKFGFSKWVHRWKLMGVWIGGTTAVLSLVIYSTLIFTVIFYFVLGCTKFCHCVSLRIRFKWNWKRPFPML